MNIGPMLDQPHPGILGSAAGQDVDQHVAAMLQRPGIQVMANQAEDYGEANTQDAGRRVRDQDGWSSMRSIT